MFDYRFPAISIFMFQANVNVTTTGGDTALHWACSAEEESGATDQGKYEERSLRVCHASICFIVSEKSVCNLNIAKVHTFGRET